MLICRGNFGGKLSVRSVCKFAAMFWMKCGYVIIECQWKLSVLNAAVYIVSTYSCLYARKYLQRRFMARFWDKYCETSFSVYARFAWYAKLKTEILGDTSTYTYCQNNDLFVVIKAFISMAQGPIAKANLWGRRTCKMPYCWRIGDKWYKYIKNSVGTQREKSGLNVLKYLLSWKRISSPQIG